MFNPFRIFSLAADAQRIAKLLERETFPPGLCLSQQVQIMLSRFERAKARGDHFENDLVHAYTDLDKTTDLLAAANAKIARMTSGLRRGSKANGNMMREAHDAEA